MDFKYYVFYKPFNVLNQFTKERPEHVTLSDFLKVDSDVYPVGRLDKDSEGLLILTNDKKMNAALLHPSRGHNKTYLVQVDNEITTEAVNEMAKGVEIKLETSTYKTKPCTVKKLPKAPVLPERNPPIRVRQNIPTSWLLITISEGKNRQIRKMCAKVGFPVLRLVRVQIENLKIGTMKPGESKKFTQEELLKLINIDQAEYNAKPKRVGPPLPPPPKPFKNNGSQNKKQIVRKPTRKK